MIRYAIAAVLLGISLCAPPSSTPGVTETIEVFGDLSTADRIAVVVPGVATTPENFNSGVAVQARNLYEAAGASRVAVVAWLGYDPPDGLGVEAARDRRARGGAVALARFARALVAARPAVTVTLVGHSYGALVVGLAAPSLPAQVTDLVALGAPGMGADRATDLRTTADVWAAQAPDDWIEWVPSIRILHLGHGVHPAAPSFGANPLPTDGVASHDGYLTPGSATLRAVAQITLDGAR